MKNLLGRLMSRPFDELKAISDGWGTLTRDPNPTHNDLAIAVYHTMVDRSAVRGVWENLDPDARSFVSWLLGQRNMLAIVDDLSAHLGRDPEETATIMERSRRIGFVDVDEVLVRGTRVVSSGDNLYSWAARNNSEAVRRKVVSVAAEAAKVLNEVIEESKRGAPFDEPFSALLQSLEQEEVQRIASNWRLPDASRYYKSELVGVMSEFVATTQGRELLLGNLGTSSRGLYSYLESEGGRKRAAEVRAHFKWDERELRTALLPLVQRALVWDVLTGEQRFLFVPPDLLNSQSAGSWASPNSGNPRSPIPNLKLETSDPYTVESRLPYELPWDLLTFVVSASQQEIPLTLQDGRITKRHAKRINDSFLHPADIKGGTEYIDLVVHLARSLGLVVEKEGEQPALAAGPRVGEWTGLSFEAQRHRIYALWQEDRKWAEPATYGTIYWWNSDLTAARKRLAQHILDLPMAQWISVDTFLRRINAVEPFIIWSQDELVRRFGLRALQGFRSHWFEIEARIVSDMIRTMFHWLGAVDLGRDKQKRFISFRVTDEGRKLLDPTHKSETVPAPPKTLLVQPTFEVLVLHPDSRAIWQLMQMADLVRHDRVSVYTINKESVVRGVEAGKSGAEMIRFLETNTGKALPQNVAHTISDWSRLIKRLEIERVTLVQVEDPSVLDELLASRKTRKYIARRLSPTGAIALLPEAPEGSREDPWQRLVKELRAAGYFPHLAPAATEGAAEESVAANGKENHEPEHGNGKTSLQNGSAAGAKRRSVPTGSHSADAVPHSRTGTR